MSGIVIYFQAHKLTWTAVPTEGAITDCATAFSILEHDQDVLLSCDVRALARFCHTRYTLVRAAGGVVTAPDGHRLLMRREGIWDLPKGMVERGETLATAALREVREETGVAAHITTPVPILKTYHIYDKYGGWHLKQTSWYAMEATAPTPLRPQTDEGIDLAEWVPTEEWTRRMNLGYASLRAVAACVSRTYHHE